MKKVTMLFSGGIDSVTLLSELSIFSDVICIFFDYGQDNFEKSKLACEFYTDYYNAELKIIKIDYNDSKSSIINGNVIKENFTYDNIYTQTKHKDFFIGGRNAVMLLMAGYIANENNSKDVYCGFQFDKPEWEIYDKLKDKSDFLSKDITPLFVEKMNELSKFCFYNPVEFIAPYLDGRLDASDITNIGFKNNVDYSKSYSCRYDGPCGECQQCLIRNIRLKNNK